MTEAMFFRPLSEPDKEQRLAKLGDSTFIKGTTEVDSHGQGRQVFPVLLSRAPFG